MPKRAKQIPVLCLLLLPLLAFLSSCENDLNKVKEIASNQVDTVLERTTGVDMIFSDSAHVQLHLTAPLLLQYQTKKPYELMPKGVKVIFYDKATGRQIGDIVADTGIRHEAEKLIEFHKNVVATNPKGETFKSDELFYDLVTKKIYSHKMVEVTMAGGDVMNGNDFETDDKFLHPSLQNSKGVFHVDEKTMQ